MSKRINYPAYIESKTWKRKLPYFHSFLMHRDCICPLFDATDIHHMTYRGLGREIFIIDVVPVSKFTHFFADSLRWLMPFNMMLRASCLFWLLVFAVIRIALTIKSFIK